LLRDAWALAIETLSWIELQRLGERLALKKAARQLEIEDSKTLGLVHKLVCETIRTRNFIDYLLNWVLTPRSLKDFKLGLQAFLRLYTYETEIAGHDFEKAVDMARIGRSILGWREFSEVEETLGKILNTQFSVLLKGISDEEKIGLSTYNPLWFVKVCFKMFGRKEALEYLESSKKIPLTYIRINTLKLSEEALLKKIESDNIVVEEIQQLRYTYKVEKSQRPLTRTQSFRDGFFFIQDKASCLSVEVANPKSGTTVLDFCAAPGAKTTYLAQLMENKGAIYSIDYSRRRMKVWGRETKRMGVKIATSVIADARNPLPIKVQADLVILDPPCTSTGAFGKIPSAKWRLTKRSALRMAKLQWDMLNQCAECVKDGGFLVYSTCSATLEENEMLIERFLKWHPEFTFAETSPKIGLPGLRGQSKCQRLYPHLHECNGFFVAKLLKES